MDDDWIDEAGWSATRIAGLGVRFFVWLVLLAVTAGAVYVTCLPSLFYQRTHPKSATANQADR